MSQKELTYKGTSKDLKCHGGFQYELGKTVTDDAAIRCGGRGYHSCRAPFDVLRYFPLREGNRYFTAEAGGMIDSRKYGDTKIASSELTLKAEIGLPGLIKAQLEYTRKQAEQGGTNGDGTNLAGGDWSNLAGGVRSNLAGGDWSNLAGGDWSNLAGDRGSLMVGRNGCRMKGGLGSVLVFTRWDWVKDEKGEWVYAAQEVNPVIVDGEKIKADVWYTLKNGEIVEAGE